MGDIITPQDGPQHTALKGADIDLAQPLETNKAHLGSRLLGLHNAQRSIEKEFGYPIWGVGDQAHVGGRHITRTEEPCFLGGDYNCYKIPDFDHKPNELRNMPEGYELHRESNRDIVKLSNGLSIVVDDKELQFFDKQGPVIPATGKSVEFHPSPKSLADGTRIIEHTSENGQFMGNARIIFPNRDHIEIEGGRVTNVITFLD